MLGLAITTLFVIIVSAMCSLAEAVLYSISPTHIEQLKALGHPSGDALEALRKDVDRPITAILTVNTGWRTPPEWPLLVLSPRWPWAKAT